MDTYECIATKLDVRSFSSEPVPSDVKLKIFEAARLTGSGMNSQHWRFILVDKQDAIRRLARESSTGGWVDGANFAVIVLTNPHYGFHLIDAGRVLQDMQLAAWNFGVASCIFTGIRETGLRRSFNIPESLTPSVVIGFGYPARKIFGKHKNRRPIDELVFVERFGEHFIPGKPPT